MRRRRLRCGRRHHCRRRNHNYCVLHLSGFSTTSEISIFQAFGDAMLKRLLLDLAVSIVTTRGSSITNRPRFMQPLTTASHRNAFTHIYAQQAVIRYLSSISKVGLPETARSIAKIMYNFVVWI